MKLEVALVPALARGGNVSVVIDVLRATSTIVTALWQRASEVVLCPAIDEARAFAAANPGCLLCGELEGLPPEGFDFGNSPYEFSEMDLAGKRLVLATTNGTVALSAAQGEVLIASTLNLSATVEAILEEEHAEEEVVEIVCSGTEKATAVALEDVYCAGMMVQRAVEMEGNLTLGDAAKLALRVYRSFPAALEGLSSSEHAREMRVAGLGQDIEFAAQIDRFDAVVRLRRERGGYPVARLAP